MPTATLAPPVPALLSQRRLPLATLDDLDVCTCSVPLDGTRPHRIWCELRAGGDD